MCTTCYMWMTLSASVNDSYHQIIHVCYKRERLLVHPQAIGPPRSNYVVVQTNYGVVRHMYFAVQRNEFVVPINYLFNTL